MAKPSRAAQYEKLKGANTLTKEVWGAVEKFLTSQIGHPRGCANNNPAPGYPARADVKNAVEIIYNGLIELCHLDPLASEVLWEATSPFVSDGDGRWLSSSTTFWPDHTAYE